MSAPRHARGQRGVIDRNPRNRVDALPCCGHGGRVEQAVEAAAHQRQRGPAGTRRQGAAQSIKPDLPLGSIGGARLEGQALHKGLSNAGWHVGREARACTLQVPARSPARTAAEPCAVCRGLPPSATAGPRRSPGLATAQLDHARDQVVGKVLQGERASAGRLHGAGFTRVALGQGCGKVAGGCHDRMSVKWQVVLFRSVAERARRAPPLGALRDGGGGPPGRAAAVAHGMGTAWAHHAPACARPVWAKLLGTLSERMLYQTSCCRELGVRPRLRPAPRPPHSQQASPSMPANAAHMELSLSRVSVAMQVRDVRQ